MAQMSPCTLSTEALEERARAWHALGAALVRAEQTTTGALLHYRLDAAVTNAVLRLVEAEHRCCPSLSFEPTVTVGIEAPEAMRSWVASTFLSGASESRASAPGEPAKADRQAIIESVRAHYAAAAAEAACCRAAGDGHGAGIGAGVYGCEERDALPPQVIASSIGCANPVAVAELLAGETVLDLGSGGGTDVLLSARRVGPSGKAYGLDMTDEMLDLARRNQAEAGIDNAEFLRGHIEAIPLPNESVDVVVSNCVIGLSPDKSQVFAEAYRVLRRGGRLALADVVADVEPTPDQQSDLHSWVSCPLTRPAYRTALEEAGFDGISIDESHGVTEGFASVVVRAVKPR